LTFGLNAGTSAPSKEELQLLAAVLRVPQGLATETADAACHSDRPWASTDSLQGSRSIRMIVG